MLGLLTCAVAVALLALLLGTRRPLQTDPDFAGIAPQSFRHNFDMNAGVIMPVATFLLQLQQSSWVPVDRHRVRAALQVPDGRHQKTSLAPQMTS